MVHQNYASNDTGPPATAGKNAGKGGTTPALAKNWTSPGAVASASGKGTKKGKKKKNTRVNLSEKNKNVKGIRKEGGSLRSTKTN